MINTFLPVGALAIFDEVGPLVAGLLVLLISLPLYVCATASVPIAAALVANGMPAGAALVFLMAGPATNVATIGAVYRGFGFKHLGLYLAVLVAGSVGFGVLFDLGLDPSVTQIPVHGGGHRSWWAILSALLLSGLILRLAIQDLMRFIRLHLGRGSAKSIEVGIEGLSCSACERKVEKALLALENVIGVVVSRNPGRAVISGEADRAEIDRAIRNAGYQPSSFADSAGREAVLP